ncbi:hypothetical protein FH972_021699 [Carpinus fangiana]|uniref:EDC4-like protein pdc1 beta-propeller domain-containing protein n=1 Tax=Carpinus fangiana TaxID=176857 RepID=A0A5N6KQQ7_9ROSI|nr:hypothetical protein FH972_021699 [Carpinus fangiana]
MADIQDLLARLKGPSGQSDASSPAPNPLAHLFATPPAGPSQTPQQAPSASHETAGSDRTTNLLNLLKFNGPSASSTPLSSAHPDRRTASTSGYVPPFVRTESAENHAKHASLQLPRSSQGDSNQRSQDALLNLLNRSQTSSTAQPSTPSAANPFLAPKPESKLTSHHESPAPRIFGTPSEKAQPTAFTPPPPKGPVFTYTNPFEQLASSSRVATPQEEPSHTKRQRRDPNLAGVKSPSPSPLADGRTQVEALLGIGATPQASSESVSHALESVSGRADKDAQQAIARAEAEHQITTATAAEIEEVARAVQDAANDIQREMKDPAGRAAIERGMSENTIQAFEQTIKAVADDPAADSWESADANATPDEAASPVKVYNFPMKPFVSINIKASSPTPPREDIVMKIASLKKAFDQVDRNLATASANFIVYALAKGGGARAIRQDTGENQTMFRSNESIMFNVSLSAPRSSPLSKDAEALLLTATNGSVYWTKIPIEQDEFDKANLDQQGLIFPPAPSAEEPTSTTQLKTRAKKSSRHPEFFAVGRGKSIYIVYPDVASDAAYIDPVTRVVDSVKYTNERCLKVSTGKAGKDFAFSEDDTVLVSLDKAGKLKFWNILQLTVSEHGLRTGKRPPHEIDTPLLTLLVNMSSEKGSPTSVQFVDKDRPTQKGSALRYMIVGLKQNHTVQLWDLALGKAVQELILPHENETDAICSIAYHPKTGIVAIGHPTRNSIFLVHLSAPRYNLDMMSQANFINRLAHKDQTLPKPDSTAILSGLREISLASIGELRSLDIMTPNTFTVEDVDPADETVFEVYAMHSRGVTCLSMKRKDLGWGPDGKVLEAFDAEAEGIITVSELQASPPVEAATTEEALAKSAPKSASTAKSESQPASVGKDQTPSKGMVSVLPNGDSKSEKRKNKKRGDDATSMSAVAPPTSILPTPQLSEQLAKSTSLPKVVDPESVDNGPQQITHATPQQTHAAPSSIADRPGASDTATTLASKEELIKASHAALTPMFDDLYKRIDDERRVQEAAGNSRQDAILRLVSSTLTDNVEKSLNRIIAANVQQSVTPAAANAATASIDRKLAELVPQHLSTALPREVKTAVQGAVVSALQNRDVLNAVADQVSSKIAAQVDVEVKAALQSTVIPAFKNLAIESAQKMTKEVEVRIGEQLRHADIQHRNDSAKISELANVSQELLQTLRMMTQSQSVISQELAQLRMQLAQQQQLAPDPTQATPPVAEEPRDEELEMIKQLMADGKTEEGTIRWLQSTRQPEFFDKFFVRCNPEYLRGLNQLVSLTVSHAVSSSLATHTKERLDWLEVVLENIDTESSDVLQYAPKILDVLNERLQDAFMEISSSSRGSPILAKIRALVLRARELKGVVAGRQHLA